MTCETHQYALLIVEDEELIAQNMKELLEEEGYCVVGIARTAEDALTLSEAHAPTAALVDVRLAEAIDGITLAQELTRLYGARIVFVTGNPLAVWRRTEGMARAILSKPFSEQELLSAVETACASE